MESRQRPCQRDFVHHVRDIAGHGLTVPFIHNLEKLLELCEQQEASFSAVFSAVKPLGMALTPYAAQLRYDEDFWPTAGEAVTALQSAQALRTFIIPRLPATMQPPI